MADSAGWPGAAELAAAVADLRAAGCVFAEDEAVVLAAAAAGPAELAELVRHRAAGLPLEHVVGHAHFCGLRVAVDPGVFVPRPRSALLARQAAALAGPAAVVVDLACGSGAIGLAAAVLAAAAELHAVDIDPAAVACARRNLASRGWHAYLGDLYEPLPAALRGQVGIVVANVPYVPSGEIAYLPAQARLHEPLAALDGGPDGLDVLRRVAAGAPGWLAPGGSVLMEVSERQVAAGLAELSRAGLGAATAADADLEAAIVIGTLPRRARR